MDWSNERYVRLYTRDTPEWKLLVWQARAIIGPLMRKLDRSGVLDFPARVGPVTAVAAVIDMPADVVGPGLDDLLEAGIFELADGRLVMPNFIEAQEAVASPAARQRAHRERRRDRSRANTDVTPGHDESRHTAEECSEEHSDVTGGHATSRDATDSAEVSPLAVPCRAVPSRAEPTTPPNPPRGGRRSRAPKFTDEERRIAGAVIERINARAHEINPRAVGFDVDSAENLRHIVKRIRAGVDLATLLAVVEAKGNEAARDPVSFRYFNAVTPFRDKNWPASLSMLNAAGRAPPGNTQQAGDWKPTQGAM